MMNAHGLEDGPMMHSYTIQDVGGTRHAIQKGIDLVNQMLPLANQVIREPIPASEIILALECGGSDSYSGISGQSSARLCGG